MYTNKELQEMDAGSLRGIVANMQEDALRYRFLREDDRCQGVCILDAGEWVKPAMVIALGYTSAEDVDAAMRLRKLSDETLTQRTLDALQC